MKWTIFSKRFLLALCLLTISASATGDEASPTNDPAFRVVGYLPDYRVDRIDPVAGRCLTDVVFFSVTPDRNGRFASKTLDSPKTVALLKGLRDEQHQKDHLCVVAE